MKRITSLFIFILFELSSLYAQTTTSSVSGVVTDSKGEALPGATVVLVYKPTNATFGVTTNEEGRYTLVNLTPGGPYEVSTTFVGYKTDKQENLNLQLGETLRLNVKLNEEATSLQEVTVTGVTVDATEKMGSGTNVGKEQIQTLPTLSRSFSDFTRLTPQSSNNSFAGTNFRYNNITLDGAINNDAIGFSPSLGGQSGTANQPGSSTRSNSFSLDAIQEVQVQIAPYDVSLGNFTGGSVNAVSKSGSNNVTGSVYAFGRNSSITGKYSGPDKVGDGSINNSYSDWQTGFRVGLPIIKDKLFLFTNTEVTQSVIPLFFNAGAPGYFLDQATANQITNKLTTMPSSPFNLAGGYNPGTSGDYNIYSRSNKFFNRLDWIINKNHTLTVRNNSVISEASNLEGSTGEFQFGSYDFVQKNRNISTVAELKSRFGNNMSNSLIVGYTDIADSRNLVNGQSLFPQVQINGVNGGRVLLGTNREAGIFNMKQKTIEFTDNFKIFKGNHTYTLGTHNEFYNIDYTFLNSYNGRFDYASLTNFLNDNPSRMRALYDPTDNSIGNVSANSPAKFNVALTSLYAQDEYAVTPKFLLTYGVRADMPILPNTPDAAAHAKFPDPSKNPNYGRTYDYGTPVSQLNNKNFGDIYISPRVGFNYDVKGDQTLIVRGGSGLFTGRVPFAWLGYAYILNGANYNALDLNPPAAGTKIPTDPSQFGAFATANKSSNRTELDVLDKNFQLPRMWRSNLAADIKLGNGYKLTLEAIYTKTIKDMQIKQINLKDSVSYASNDAGQQQPLYLQNANVAGVRTAATGGRVTNAFSSVYLITNTSLGERYQLTAQLSKQYSFGLNAMLAYTYGQSKDLFNGIRNSPESSWQLNQALNPNNPSAAFSNFDIRHRIVSSFQYKKSWSESLTSYVSLIFTAQSGTPYTYAITSSNNLTRNGQQIDLAFIPNTKDQINLVAKADGTTTDAQWAALDNFINGDPYLSTHRGQFTERNGARTPWNNNLDLRLMQDFNFKVGEKTHTFQLTFDIINFTNLLNSNWGKSYFVPNTLNGSVDMGLAVTRGATSVAPATYTFTTPTSTYSVDQFASRWQGQLGLRYIF